jgi:serine/threonine protein kinase
MAPEAYSLGLLGMGMLTNCLICDTPLTQKQTCPNHPNNTQTLITSPPQTPLTLINPAPPNNTLVNSPPQTLINPTPTNDTLEEDQGDNLSTVNDSSHFGSNRAGEYILLEKLGEGGMGEVWLAIQPTIQKKVAVKILHSKFVSNKQVLSRFMQEAKAVNQIDHKNLVDIFIFGELPDKRPYFVMEYLQGKNLTYYLKKGVLPYNNIISISEQVCRALDAAHQAGVIHRDLKPDNLHLIFSEKAPPFVKILDFGIAKLTDTPEAQALTRTGMIFGTPAYMSPEQCEGAKNVDHRSDQYAIAVILYEMLTGKNPFKERGDSAAVTLKKQIIIKPPPPSSFVKGRHFPKGIDAVVLKALSKDPDKRFLSCSELHEALVKAIENQEPLLTEASTAVELEAQPKAMAHFYTTEKLKKITSPAPSRLVPTKPNNKSLLTILLITAVIGSGFGLFIVSQLAKKNTPITSPKLSNPPK